MDAADRGAAQAGALILPNVDTPVFHEIFIQFLKVAGGQLGEFYFADPGDGIGFDHQLVPICCGEADVGLGVEVVPGFRPGGDSVFFGTDYIKIPGFLQNLRQFLLDLALSFAEDILDDAFTGDGIVSGGVATLPAAIASLTDISFAVGAAFCHRASTPFSGSYNTYHTLAKKATLFFVCASAQVGF